MSLMQDIGRRGAEIVGRESSVVRRMRPLYESLLNMVSGGRGIAWRINGVEYRIDARCRQQLSPEYDAPIAQFLQSRIAPGSVCFDVGANVGVYVLQMARWSGPDGTVVAFEPNPETFSLLRRHVEINDLTERVTLVPAAVGNEMGEATLFALDRDGMSRLGAPNVEISNRTVPITVPLVTLDGYCAQNSVWPDWLFVDVEGFEIKVLEGARETIRERKRAMGILVEMHPNVWTSADTTRESASRLLDDLGLEAIPLTGQVDPLGDYGIVQLLQR